MSGARIAEPGIYDMPAEAYHADPCAVPSLSASICKVLCSETPQHAFTKHPRLNHSFEDDRADKFNIGQAAHSMILRDPKTFAIGQWNDWKKKEAQEFKAAAHAAGKIPLLAEQFARVEMMAATFRAQVEASDEFRGAFQNGKPEQTIIWEEHGVWFRSRLDWLYDDQTYWWDDYKSTESADPESWKRIVFSDVRHDIQAAFYRRGIRALKLCRQPRMRFLVQETKDPHCMSAINFSPEVLELADREIERAIRKWRWCLQMNQWPGYPGKVVTVEPPSWWETQRMEREERMAEIAKRNGVDPDLLELSIRFQAPI